MNAPTARQMKLFHFPWNTGSHVAGWRHPGAASAGLGLAFYQDLVRIIERGRFDALMMPDNVGFHQVQGRDAYSRTDIVKLEPLTLMGALAATSRNVGFIATASTSYNQPYTLARQFASLDHISGGRMGWNMVTSSAVNEARNHGLDTVCDHDERYERAAEFVEVCRRLWDSFDDDAVLIDKASGRYFDPDKLHGLNHVGRYYKVAGPLNLARPPQGHPVLAQAGGSKAGRAFSARFADAVFGAHPSLEMAQAYYRDIKALVAEQGRDAEALKVMAAMQPIVASTEAEAWRIQHDLDELIHSDLAISILQGSLGEIDLSAYPLDGPLPQLETTQGGRGTQSTLIEIARRENLSIRQLAHRFAAERNINNIVGTPEQVADIFERWFAEGAADGFVVTAPYLPGALEAFVDHVIPILQDRGLFRKDYEGATLRENLGLPRPVNSFHARSELHHEPEIW